MGRRMHRADADKSPKSAVADRASRTSPVPFPRSFSHLFHQYSLFDVAQSMFPRLSSDTAQRWRRTMATCTVSFDLPASLSHRPRRVPALCLSSPRGTPPRTQHAVCWRPVCGWCSSHHTAPFRAEMSVRSATVHIALVVHIQCPRCKRR